LVKKVIKTSLFFYFVRKINFDMFTTIFHIL
jgi:hypothetical protein